MKNIVCVLLIIAGVWVLFLSEGSDIGMGLLSSALLAIGLGFMIAEY
jgi:hypothetical protein